MSMQILSKTTVFDAKAFTIEKLHVRLPDARERDYSLVRHNDSVTIIPLDAQNNVIFVSQFRMGCEIDLLELPAGVMNPGETPLECAEREIREETGMAAQNMIHLGNFYMSPGYATEYMYCYLARGLYHSPLTPDTDEFLNIQKIPLAEVRRMVSEQAIEDSKTLAVLALAEKYLR